MTTSTPLLEVQDLRVYFQFRRAQSARVIRALDGVSLTLDFGETLGLVGESGCGKSTLARAIVRLQTVTSGSIKLDGIELTTQSRRELKKTRRRMQMIFQNPFASLNPRLDVRTIVGEPLAIYGVDKETRNAQVERLLVDVGLERSHADRLPSEFSGGQRQRIGIARALALNPDLIVADEPVSALDVSIQAQIVNLLQDLQDQYGMSLLFITHDLAVVQHVSDHVAVMYMGKVVERGRTNEIFKAPSHPYTAALLSSVLTVGAATKRDSLTLRGEVPSAFATFQGCNFMSRCPLYRRLGQPDICSSVEPILRATSTTQVVACHFYERVNWKATES